MEKFDYSRYLINYDKIKPILVDAFANVIGENYRSVFKKRMDEIILLDYVFPQHLNRYNKDRGIDEVAPIYEGNDSYELERMREIYNLNPDNEILKREFAHMKQDDSYSSPLLRLLVKGYMILAFEKLGLVKLEGLSFSERMKALSSENEKRIWAENFVGVDIDEVIKINMKYAEAYEIDCVKHKGNIPDIARKFEWLTGEKFDYSNFINNNKPLKCLSFGVINGKVFKVLFNPNMFLRETAVLSLVHEFVHGLALVYDKEKNVFYAGLQIFDMNDGTDKFGYANEAITQLIASEVTKYLIDTGLDREIFPFEIDLQTADPLTSYPGPVQVVNKFFVPNREAVINNYFNVFDKVSLDLGYIDAKAQEGYNASDEQVAKIISEVEDHYGYKKANS